MSKERRIPFTERPTCRIDEAVEASGLGRSLLYALFGAGHIKTIKRGKVRLVVVPSLLEYLSHEQTPAA